MTASKPAPKRTTRWTKAQQASLKAWEKKHPFPKGGGSAAAGAGAGINPGGPMKKPARSTRPAPGTVNPGGPMIPARGAGGGRHGTGRHGLAQPGDLPVCAALAVAESLLAATGTAAGEAAILRLHGAAGGDTEGAPLAGVLAALGREGMAGIRPPSVAEVFPADGTVVSLALEMAQAEQEAWDADPSPPWGLHAAYLTGGHVLTWGRAVPVTEAFLRRQALAAWRITWPERAS